MPTSRAGRDRPSELKGPVEKWLREARDGSPSALGRALEAGRSYLLRVANRGLRDKLKAKVGGSDLVQDTFVEAQRAFGSFRGTTEREFYAWLLAILRNRMSHNGRLYNKTQCRNVERELPIDLIDKGMHEPQDEAPTPFSSFLAREEQRRIREALDKLEEPWRSILLERTWHGDSFAEIGARRNCSADAARKAWARGFRKLQQLLLASE